MPKEKKIKKLDKKDAIEEFYTAWMIKQDYGKCKDYCDDQNVIFYDRRDKSESEGYNMIIMPMYFYHQVFTKDKITLVNHLIEDDGTLYYRARRRGGEHFNGLMDFTVNDDNKITRIEIGKVKSKFNKFDELDDKIYEFRLPDPVNLSQLPIWDYEYCIQESKGTMYAMMFKLYRIWMLAQDVNEMMRVMASDAHLHDRVMEREFHNGKECANYFFTFIAHHHVSGIYMRQYKIIDNELIVKMHWPHKQQDTDIMITAKMNEDNKFTDILIRKAYFNAFTDPGDITSEMLKKMENVHNRRIADITREEEDFRSAVFYGLDKNVKDLGIGTFDSTDTEVFLRDKILNENDKCIVEERKLIVPSPKAPLKLIYDYPSRILSDDDFDGIPKKKYRILKQNKSTNQPESDDSSDSEKQKKQKKATKPSKTAKTAKTTKTSKLDKTKK